MIPATISTVSLFSLAISEPDLEGPIMAIIGRLSGASPVKRGKKALSSGDIDMLIPGLPDAPPARKNGLAKLVFGAGRYSLGPTGELCEKTVTGKQICASREIYDLTAHIVSKGRHTRTQDIADAAIAKATDKDLHAGIHSVSACLRYWSTLGLIRYARGIPTEVACKNFATEAKAAYGKLEKLRKAA